MANRKRKLRQTKESSENATSHNEAPVEGLSTKTKNLQVCRLCENDEGPFLNIFDNDKVHKKIENLMPFSITKTDELPHNVCFRCIAKVDEFYEFIQKCIKSQENLHNNFGKNPPIMLKTKTKERLYWEEKLMTSNKSHEDICDEVVKRAMKAIINSSDSPSTSTVFKYNPQVDSSPYTSQALTSNVQSLPNGTTSQAPELKSEQSSVQKSKSPNSVQKSKTPNSLQKSKTPTIAQKSETPNPLQKSKNTGPSPVTRTNLEEKTINTPVAPAATSVDDESDVVVVKDDIDIMIEKMPFISTIKVNGVGLLYQCQMCNRNFLNKTIVVCHGCTKNKKVSQLPEKPAQSDVPKPPAVKFINTSSAANSEGPKKHKAGPASKTGRVIPVTREEEEPVNKTSNTTFTPTLTAEQFIELSNSYTLVPGPGNKYTLAKKSAQDDDIPKNIATVTPSTVTSASVALKNENVGKSSGPSITGPSRNTSRGRPRGKKTRGLSRNVAGGDVSVASASNMPYPVRMFTSSPSTAAATYNSNENQVESEEPGDAEYTCNLCDLKFNRQQKLVVHLHSHYQDEYVPPSPKHKRARKK